MTDKKTILIIEDDKDLSKTLMINLEMEGYSVCVADNGYEGIYKAKNPGADLIILDLMLPGLSGEEICKELRKDENYKSLPIIMLTAKDTDTDMIIGRVIGADVYIRKPFDMDELLMKIRTLLQGNLT